MACTSLVHVIIFYLSIIFDITIDLVDTFNRKKVNLVSNKENLDTSTPTGKLMLTMIAAINEFERANLLERQKEGIAIAKRKGIYKGRKAVSIPDFKVYYNRYLQREISKSELAKELQISRPTLDKQIKLYLEKSQKHFEDR